MPPWDSITPMAFKFSNWVTAIQTVTLGLSRRIIKDLVKVAGVPLTNLWLKNLVIGMSSGLSPCEWAGLKQIISSNIPVSLSLWTPFSSLIQGRSSILVYSRRAIFWSKFQPNKLLGPFWAPRVAALNAKPLLSEPIYQYIRTLLTLCSSHHYLPPIIYIYTHVLWISVCINFKTQVV